MPEYCKKFWKYLKEEERHDIPVYNLAASISPETIARYSTRQAGCLLVREKVAGSPLSLPKGSPVWWFLGRKGFQSRHHIVKPDGSGVRCGTKIPCDYLFFSESKMGICSLCEKSLKTGDNYGDPAAQERARAAVKRKAREREKAKQTEPACAKCGKKDPVVTWKNKEWCYECWEKAQDE